MTASAGFRCRGCGADQVERVIDLGAQPAADHFPDQAEPGPDPRWPLEVWFCRACTLAQLGPVETQLPEPPLAIESATSVAHAQRSVQEILRDHPGLARGSVAEFASHHGGSWLDHLRAAGCRVAGDRERADLVVDVHGLAHEPDVRAQLQRRAERLAPDGLLILEFHHLLPLVVGNQFDTIRHGHWSYLSLGAVQRLAPHVGLAVVSAKKNDLFGGSLKVMLRHAGSGVHADQSVADVLDAEATEGLSGPDRLSTMHEVATKVAAALHETLVAHRAAGRSVLGYGAPSKAPVLLDLSGIGTDLLPFTVDKAAAKHGRRIPGAGVPIRPVHVLEAARPDVVLVLTWDIADEVIAALEAGGGWGAAYLVPLPEPHLVSP